MKKKNRHACKIQDKYLTKQKRYLTLIRTKLLTRMKFDDCLVRVRVRVLDDGKLLVLVDGVVHLHPTKCVSTKRQISKIH